MSDERGFGKGFGKGSFGSSFGSSKRREKRPAQRRERKRGKPLDETSLRDLALSYAARFATTGAKLEEYLARKIRERGVAEEGEGESEDEGGAQGGGGETRAAELDVAGLVTRLIELGYVDDEAYARAKTRDLTQRGYGARRVEQALWAAGVEEEVRSANALSERAARNAAVLMAKKRRFGPFGRADDDGGGDGEGRCDTPENLAARQKLREKQVAAMLRAGHSFDHVRFILDAAARDDIDEWLAEAQADEADDDNEQGHGLW